VTQFARFADEGGKITVNGAKSKLFEPNRENKLSVFDVTGRTDKDICETGIEQVAKPKGKRLHGWAKITSTHIEQAGLEIIHDDNPPGHANVIWPEGRDDKRTKSLQLARLAQDVIKIAPPVETCEACGTSEFNSV